MSLLLALLGLDPFVHDVAVALTVTPVVALLLLPHAAREPRVPRVVAALRARYAYALMRVLDHPRTMRLAIVGVILAGLAMAPMLELEFLPQF
jgi:multidrug efflux pump subunit AcrB